MARLDEGPHVRVYQGDTLSCLPATAYEPLTHALQEGEIWWEGVTLHGSPILIRCSSITDVTLMTAASLASIREENDQPEWAS